MELGGRRRLHAGRPERCLRLLRFPMVNTAAHPQTRSRQGRASVADVGVVGAAPARKPADGNCAAAGRRPLASRRPRRPPRPITAPKCERRAEVELYILRRRALMSLRRRGGIATATRCRAAPRARNRTTPPLAPGICESVITPGLCHGPPDPRPAAGAAGLCQTLSAECPDDAVAPRWWWWRSTIHPLRAEHGVTPGHASARRPRVLRTASTASTPACVRKHDGGHAGGRAGGTQWHVGEPCAEQRGTVIIHAGGQAWCSGREIQTEST